MEGPQNRFVVTGYETYRANRVKNAATPSLATKRQSMLGTSCFNSVINSPNQNRSVAPSTRSQFGIQSRRMSVKEEEDYMAFISNQRSVLPALTKNYEQKAQQNQPEEFSLAMKDLQDSNQFQYDLLLERNKREPPSLLKEKAYTAK